MVSFDNDSYTDPTNPQKPKATFGGALPPPGFDANQPVQPPPGQPPLGPLQPPTAQPGLQRPVNPGGITSIVPPAPSMPGTTGSVGGTTQFGPGNNLIQTQVNPGDPTDTAGVRKQFTGALGNLTDAPDRFALANDALKTFDQNQADTEKLGIRDIGRNAAAAGRLGSGMVSTDLGDLQLGLNKERDQYTRGLTNDAASATLNDRLNVANTTGSGLSELSGLDLQGRNELRGERDYQSGQNQQNINNNVAQQELTNATQGQDFQQKLAQLGLLGGQGFSSSPTGTALANYYASQGGDLNSAIAQLLYGLGQKKAA